MPVLEELLKEKTRQPLQSSYSDTQRIRPSDTTIMTQNLGSLCLYAILTKSVFQNYFMLKKKKSSLISKNVGGWGEVEEEKGKKP